MNPLVKLLTVELELEMQLYFVIISYVWFNICQSDEKTIRQCNNCIMYKVGLSNDTASVAM